MRDRLFLALVLWLTTGLVALANGALVSRGGGLVYDTDRNLTWLADPALGRGSAYDDGDSLSDGRMTYGSAVAWAASLDYAGYSDWRLPQTPMRDVTCSLDNTAVNYGYGCSANELGHLFYDEFGAAAGQAVSASGSPYLALFGQIADAPGDAGYWFDSPWCCGNIPGFRFAGGELVYTVSQNQYYAWAVRDGDIALLTEPGSLPLLATLLLVLWLHASARNLARRGLRS